MRFHLSNLIKVNTSTARVFIAEYNFIKVSYQAKTTFIKLRYENFDHSKVKRTLKSNHLLLK